MGRTDWRVSNASMNVPWHVAYMRCYSNKDTVFVTFSGSVDIGGEGALWVEMPTRKIVVIRALARNGCTKLEINYNARP